MKVAPGLFLVLVGLGLLAAGLWARCGWEIAAMVIGTLAVAIGLWSMPDEARR